MHNPNVSESSPQIDESSYQSNNSVTNTPQVGSSYIERQQKAKNYGRLQAGNENNKNSKKPPVIPAKYQHLFKSNAPGSDKYHSNVTRPDGKYPNYLPQHRHIKHDDISDTGTSYSHTYRNMNDLNDDGNLYKTSGVYHEELSDQNNDGDAYFLDDGMEGMDIDGESTVSQLVFTEWGEDPVYDNADNLPDDGVHTSNISTNNYIPYGGDDENLQDSLGNDNVWKDYYYEDHEGKEQILRLFLLKP